METLHKLPPVSSADPAPDCFSSFLVNLGKHYGHRKRRLALFLPRAIWPVPSVYHDYAYATDVDFMKDQKQYKKAPSSKINAVLTLSETTATSESNSAPFLIH